MEALRKVWQAWKRFGQFMGDLVGRLVLTLFYFTFSCPLVWVCGCLGTRWRYVRVVAQNGWNAQRMT